MVEAEEQKFVSTTANYFDPANSSFRDSGLKSIGSREVISQAAPFILTNAPYISGAMIAVTMALTSPAYASETQPRFDDRYLNCIDFEVASESQLARSLGRLAYLGTKPSGWKGPNSVALADGTRSACTEFLTQYFAEGEMREPFIGLDEDGDITLFWKGDDLIMDLSISDGGHYSFYAEAANGETFHADDENVSSRLPAELLAHLRTATA